MTGRDYSLNIKFNPQVSTTSNTTTTVSESTGSLFEGQVSGNFGKGVTVESLNKETLQKLIQKAGLSMTNVSEAKVVTLANGEQTIVISLKSDKGNSTTLTFNRDNEDLIEHSTTNKGGITTTTSYNQENVRNIVISQKNQTITADELSRILKRESKTGTVEYTYNDETIIPTKILERLKDGTLIEHQNGEKITTNVDGTKTSAKDSLTRQISQLLNDSSTISTTAPKSLDPAIFKDIDLSKLKKPQKKREPKEIAKLLQKLFFQSSSSKTRSQNIQKALALITSSNVDWVLYEYKVLTNRDLFADIKIVFKNAPKTFKAYNQHFANIQYEKYGVKTNFKNNNSVVSNKYRQGDPHSIVQEGTIITVTNKKTGKTRQLDLDVLLKNYPNAKDRARVIKQLQSLPGEVLMDISIETDSFIPAKVGETVSVGNGLACNAAGYYSPSNDTVHLDQNGTTQTLVHEMGHTVDFCGKANNSSVATNTNFKRIFNAEMRNFLSAGNQRFVYTPDGKGSGSPGSYATANEREMFAECYTLLMTGNCGSKAVIEKYFPKCLAFINKQIEINRSQRDSYRH